MPARACVFARGRSPVPSRRSEGHPTPLGSRGEMGLSPTASRTGIRVATKGESPEPRAGLFPGASGETWPRPHLGFRPRRPGQSSRRAGLASDPMSAGLRDGQASAAKSIAARKTRTGASGSVCPAGRWVPALHQGARDPAASCPGLPVSCRDGHCRVPLGPHTHSSSAHTLKS